MQADARAIAEARYTLGVLLLQSGEFDRAAKVLLSAEKTLGDTDPVETALGFALLRRGAIPGPEGDPLARSCGEVETLLLDSRYDQALPRLQNLLAKNPKVPHLHYALGTALIALSEFDEASAQMQEELKLAPADPLPYEALASIALREHRAADGLPYAERAVSLRPAEAEPHYLLGRSLLESGTNIPRAVKELEKAAELNRR